jgi:hypothetical protein
MSAAASTWRCLYAAGGDLWLTTGDLSEQITNDGHLAQPAAGPNALAYVEREKNYSDIWFVTGDLAPRRVTQDASPVIAVNHWSAQPVLEPDGQHAYVLADFDKQATGVGGLAIWELDLQRGSARQISHPPAYVGGDQDVTLNPHDGQQIVFTRYQYDATGQLTESLTWLDVRVRSAVPLTPATQATRQAAFSPDGLWQLQMDARNWAKCTRWPAGL